ncbi:unnamed protein product [Ectocarpus sp. 4 AP-2014]
MQGFTNLSTSPKDTTRSKEARASRRNHREDLPATETTPTDGRIFRMFFWSRSVFAWSIFQAPDLIRLEEGAHRTHRTKSRRLRRAALRRDVGVKRLEGERQLPALPLLENKIFTKREAVNALSRASADCGAVEGFVDPAHLSLARQQEYKFSLLQGINHNPLKAHEASMTTKMLLLFSFDLLLSGTITEAQLDTFWERVIPYAVVGGAGTLVKELFRENLLGHDLKPDAIEWLRECDTEGSCVHTDGHLYLPPRFFPVDDEHEPACVTGGVGGGTAPLLLDNESTSEEGGDDVGRRMEKQKRVVELGDVLRSCETKDKIKAVVLSYNRKRPEFSDTSAAADDMKYCSVEPVYRAIDILAKRNLAIEYRRQLETTCRVASHPREDPRTPDDAGGDSRLDLTPGVKGPDSKGTPVRFRSIECNVRTLVQKSPRSEEMDSLLRYGFFKTKVFADWYIIIAELLAESEGREYEKLFLKSRGEPDPGDNTGGGCTYDDQRGFSRVHKDDILFHIIVGPLMRKLKALGALAVCGEDLPVEGAHHDVREVGYLGVIRSRPNPPGKEVPQGFHVDNPPSHNWGDKFGFSTITAGSNVARVDIYPESFDGSYGQGQIPVTVTLLPAETIVFNGLARHRGASYLTSNLRFFLSFVVKSEAARTEDEKKDLQTSELESIAAKEGDPVPFESWIKSRARGG